MSLDDKPNLPPYHGLTKSLGMMALLALLGIAAIVALVLLLR